MKIQNLEARVPVPHPSPSPARATPRDGGSGAPAEPSPFSRVLHKLARDVDRGEKTVNAAMAGQNVHDPAALLALQAGVYKYVEAVDLASKLVDRATSAVKTVLQGQ